MSVAHVNDLERRRLRWRARRGLLENDLLLGRFLECRGDALDHREAAAFARLLELPDNDLLDLLLARKEPEPPLDTADIRALLAQMRAA